MRLQPGLRRSRGVTTLQTSELQPLHSRCRQRQRTQSSTILAICKAFALEPRNFLSPLSRRPFAAYSLSCFLPDILARASIRRLPLGRCLKRYSPTPSPASQPDERHGIQEQRSCTPEQPSGVKIGHNNVGANTASNIFGADTPKEIFRVRLRSSSFCSVRAQKKSCRDQNKRFMPIRFPHGVHASHHGRGRVLEHNFAGGLRDPQSAKREASAPLFSWKVPFHLCKQFA